MFKNKNHTLLLALFAILSLAGCKTNIYSLNPCIKSMEVTTEQDGHSQTITATISVTGNIQFDIKSPFVMEKPLSLTLKSKSVANNPLCDGRQEEARNLVYTFNGIVPSLPAGEYLLDAKKDFTKTN